MNTEQERAAFEAWAVSIGLSITGRYAESLTVLCAESAFKAGYRAALQSQEQEDTKRLNWLRKEACDLRCINVPTSGDDCDVRWVVIQHHMSEPYEREIGRSFTDDPRDAIDHAIRHC